MRNLHNLSHQDAKRFYLDSVKPTAQSNDEAVTLPEKDFNSAVRQTRVKKYLGGLRLTQYLNDSTDTAAALAKVCKHILSMSRQVSIIHRGDAHKIDFLRVAVVGNPWAKEALSSVATAEITFQQLYEELEIAFQLERESLPASRTNPVQSLPANTVPSIKYTGKEGMCDFMVTTNHNEVECEYALIVVPNTI